MSTRLPPAFKLALGASAILHAVLIVYGAHRDARSHVKYTDIDYVVFSDASRFVLSSETAADRAGRTVGPWGGWLGSPYDRSTYRYTPLLAVLLTPNHLVHPAFGKALFSACDLLVGYLLYLLFPSSRRASATKWIVGLWLLNPFALNISTRGSSESLLGAVILLSLYCFKRSVNSAGGASESGLSKSEVVGSIMLGLAVHIKIYPVVFALALLGYFGRFSRSLLGQLGMTRKGIEFGLVSGGTFALTTLSCYLIWGYEAIFHPYLYHLTRLDHRHNFSPYFYPIYLLSSACSLPTLATSPALVAVQRVIRSPLASFVPQLGLSSALAFTYGRRGELAMGWAVSTAVFVTFNKVVTSQYFLWYLSFLPLVLLRVQLSHAKAFSLTAAWVLAQALWLSQAYKLEFLGEQVFSRVWACSIVFLGVNTWVLGEVIQGFR